MRGIAGRVGDIADLAADVRLGLLAEMVLRTSPPPTPVRAIVESRPGFVTPRGPAAPTGE